jgi:hypothetical protein
MDFTRITLRDGDSATNRFGRVNPFTGFWYVRKFDDLNHICKNNAKKQRKMRGIEEARKEAEKNQREEESGKGRERKEGGETQRRRRSRRKEGRKRRIKKEKEGRKQKQTQRKREREKERKRERENKPKLTTSKILQALSEPIEAKSWPSALAARHKIGAEQAEQTRERKEE